MLGGNRSAFRLLILRYQRPLFKFLGGFGIEQAIAEELAQETFLRAYRSLSVFDSAKSAFSTWLLTIAKRLAINETRRSRARVVHVTIGDAATEEPSAGEQLESAQRSHRVRRALQGLPLALRSAVVLAYMKEHTLAEIAAIENCSIGAIKSRIHRGKGLLRIRLAGMEE
ncbi:MAG: sigma-70 family RNA polymerase sigma factor [Polyangia bacterium]